MWRSRIFWRLFATYSTLQVLGLALVGWLLLQRVERRLLNDIRQGLEMKTVLVRDLVTAPPTAPETRADQVRRLAAETHTRITLIAADGTVLADSEARPEQMDNHLGRPEVREAEATGTGMSSRFSDTVAEPLMYVARRLDQGPVRYVRLGLPLAAVTAEVRWLRGAAWTAAVGSLVVTLLLSLALARRLSAPLVELADAAHSVAQGEYGQRVPVASTDEVGNLAAAFNDMSQACAAHIAQMEQDRQQLRAIFRSMVEGVLVIDPEQRIRFFNDAASRLLNLPPGLLTQRKLWEVVRHRQLGEAVERILVADEPYHAELEWHGPDRKFLTVHGSRLPGSRQRGAVLVFHDLTHLRKLERVRQDFFANVSHELKTPLAAISATAETLLDGALRDPEHNVRFLERIRENAERLHRLVQDLLALGRIEAGEAALDVQPIALAHAVEACVARHEARAAAKRLRLEQSPPLEPVTTRADEEALAEILDNLVDNAIKYTPEDGHVTLRWFSQDGRAVLQVEDSGIGIPAKDLARIFERFYRVDKARSRQLGGTGLGLSIVKHLTQALGGSVEAVSVPGSGSTFTVRLPLASAAPVPVVQGATESA
jgi:two-component system phosphate regulon sensor histidine kinase PhoR